MNYRSPNMHNVLLTPNRLAFAGLIIIFFLSRMVFSQTGIRFDTFPLYTSWQFVDPELLRTDLLQSIFYLHSQPPLFNLFLGCVLKAVPEHLTTAFRVVFMLLGLTLSLSMFALMRRLGVFTWLAFTLTTLFVISPGFILYENWLFYTMPLALLLVAGTLFMTRFLNNERLLDGVLFFGFLGATVLTRSLFHILWFVSIAAVLLFFKRNLAKKVLIAAALPFLIVTAWHGKNLVLFGTPSSSTWLGMSLAKMTTEGLPLTEREALVHDERLSSVSLVRPFSNLDKYRDLIPPTASRGIPVLDQEMKSSANTNFNHAAFIRISRLYFDDACSVIRSHPEIYAAAMLHAYCIYFRPANDYALLEENRAAIRRYDAAFSAVLFGQVLQETPTLETGIFIDSSVRQFLRSGIILGVVFMGAIGYGLLRVKRLLVITSPDRNSDLTLLFMVFTVVYVTLLGNALEIGENNRFRFMIDPFVLILFGLFIQERITRWRRSENH